jgi:NAD(P)-dependent dehydrogenase (short-subunit alcohol dehydrogenase family)
MTGRPQAEDRLADKRADPPPIGDERATLTGFLNYQRQTLLLKCAGLSPEQLLERATPPSTLCLLGLVRHLTDVEFGWLQVRFAGAEDVELYGSDDADLAVGEADPESVTRAFGLFAEQVARADVLVAGAELGALSARAHPVTGQRYSLRWILCHLIEEYARHNGHADLLREAIDGTVGE